MAVTRLLASNVHRHGAMDGLVRRTAVIAGRGMRELELPKPVRPEHKLTGTVEVLETNSRSDRDETAVSAWRVELRADSRDIVLSMLADIVVRRQPTRG